MTIEVRQMLIRTRVGDEAEDRRDAPLDERQLQQLRESLLDECRRLIEQRSREVQER